MKYQIRHLTRYSYEKPIHNCYNILCMQPRETSLQKCLSFDLKISPDCTFTNSYKDYFDNEIVYFSIDKPHKVLEVCSESIISNQKVSNQNEFFSLPWEAVREKMVYSQNQEDFKAYEFVMDSPFIRRGTLFEDFARRIFKAKRPLLDAVLDFTRYIFKEFEYKSGATNIYTPLEEVLDKQHGVCQDFTHLSIVCLRSLGIPSRYVSGYMETQPPPGKEKLQGADATHAWYSVYFPGYGWLDFDPTNGKMVDERYIVTAIGRDFSDISPLKGVLFGGGKSILKVEVDVNPIA
ncbi:MAG: transglutaminase family protein [Spirochaetota bacterium]